MPLRFAWYPTFFALVWGVQQLAANDMDLGPAARSLFALAAGSLTITFVVQLLVRRSPISAAIAGVIVLAFLRGGSPGTLGAFALLAVLIAIEQRFEHLGRLRLPWATIHNSITVIAAVMLGVGIATYSQALVSRPEATYQSAWFDQSLALATRPNLYVIIADGHGRADVLHDSYGYDKSAFVAGLQSLGFQVASSSRANYLDTEQSLPSFFSGAHLSDLGMDMARPPDPVFLAAALRENPATQALHNLGYQV